MPPKAVEIYYLLFDTEQVNLSFLRLVRVVKIAKSLQMFNITSALAPLHLLIKCLEVPLHDIQ